VSSCAVDRLLPQSIAMEVTYELTQRDFFDSFIAHRNSSVLRKWFFRIIVLTVFAFLAIGLLGAILRPYPKVWSDLTPLFFLAGFWVLLMWASPWWAARNQFLKQPGAQGPRAMLRNNSGIHWQWNGGSADVEWKNFIRFHETKKHFLLYSSPACFNIVPKRTLTTEQMDALRTVVRENLLPGATPSTYPRSISPGIWVLVVVVVVAAVLLVMALRNIH
jgi:hypothetical protein